MIPEEIKNKILQAANLMEVAADLFTLKKTGRSFYTQCPKCDKKGKGKGLIFTPGSNSKPSIYKCFSCDFSGTSSVNLLMETQNMNYPDALNYLAKKYSIDVLEKKKPRGPQRKTKKKEKTFCDKQMEESGLSGSLFNIQAEVYVDDKTTKLKDVYEAGTRDQWYRIVPGDDMIIWYYDLEGKPTLYKKPKSQKFEHFYRIRWQFPDHHLDKRGKPIKYQSPSGSGSHLYIPQIIRNIYKDKRIIKRLYIQEGEKKADKACLHGIPSVGIPGIQGIAKDGRLPHELQLIIQACKVEEVIFVLDADWDHLSRDLITGHQVDQRPGSFFRAVRNFRDYFKAFNNIGIYLELYFGYIKENDKKDKGIDDLLTNTLKAKEIELSRDFDRAVNDIKEKDGTGDFIQVHKVTTLTDYQIMQFWSLENTKSFLKKYKEILYDHFPKGEIFKIGRLEWRWMEETNQFEPAQPLTPNEQYWEEITWDDARGQMKKKLLFDYVNLKNFLRNRGFGRIMMANGKYLFAKSMGKVIQNIEAGEVKDFVVEFTEEIAPKDVQNMILRGARMYLGPESLGNMSKMFPVFSNPDKDYQALYFKDKYWQIYADKIDEKPLNQLPDFIWSDKIIDFDASLVKNDLLNITMVTDDILKKIPKDKHGEYRHFLDQFNVEFTAKGKECDFLQFLNNTSEFAWRKMVDLTTRKPKKDERTLDEKFETNMHLISKLTALGYLLHDYHNKSIAKAVICMDGKMSEVGQSNGRSGKSILGNYIDYIIPQVYIGSKQKKLTEDPFLFEGVSEKTKNVFFDDVRANIDIEFFYPHITGKFAVRPLGEKRFILPDHSKPKLIFTTNHGVNDAGGSLRDRVFLLAFSDFYSENHKPIDDFGVNFFEEWDSHQWNLAYNLAATCLKLYFKFGLVKAPMKRLEMRNLRQVMGENFLIWADEYFSLPDNLNHQIPRQELYDAFLEKVPTEKRYSTPNSFKKKMKAYCKFRELEFNPHLTDPDGNPKKFDRHGRAVEDDKKGGIEYFTIGNDDFNGI